MRSRWEGGGGEDFRWLPKPRAFNRAAKPGEGFRGWGWEADGGVFVVEPSSRGGSGGVGLLEVVSWRESGSKERSWKSSLGISVKVRTESPCCKPSLLPWLRLGSGLGVAGPLLLPPAATERVVI